MVMGWQRVWGFGRGNGMAEGVGRGNGMAEGVGCGVW